MQYTQQALETALQLHQSNQLDKAAEIYKEVLSKNPNDPNTMYFYGMLLVQTSQQNEALHLFEKLLSLNPPEQLLKDTHNFIGEIYLNNKNDVNTATKHFQKVIELSPSDFAANFYLGNINLATKNADAAIKNYVKALRAETNQVDIYTRLLEAYKLKNDLDNIITTYLQLIKLEPKNAKHYYNAGLYYYQKNDAENTYKAYMNAIQLEPNFVEPYINLGSLYHQLFDLDNAKKYLEKALELNDSFHETYIILGNTYVDTCETDKVKQLCEKGLQKYPNSPNILFNLGRANLLDGHIDKGWDYFKLRRLVNEKKELGTYLLDYNGSLKDKKVLVYYDSGFGDSIQFLRYVHLLRDEGAKVVLKVQPALVELVKASNINVEIVPGNVKVNEIDHDFHINLTSLAYLFKRDVDNFPLTDKYLFSNKEKVKEYKEKYFNNNEFKVGIVWRSHANTRGVQNINDVMTFYPIAKIPGVKMYSIQQLKGQPWLDNIPEDFEITKLGDEFKSFDDTAAAIENLDLLITSDNAVCHLAGSMGKRVWVPIPTRPNWRWSMVWEKTPWYDSMKTFRQKNAGDWKEVFQRIEAELKTIIS